MLLYMKAEELALVQGWEDTRTALRRWNAAPARALRPWALGSAAVAVALLPHAAPELFALFLPLAAWTIASRRGAWHELLAATFVTTAVAIPILVAAAAIETWATPHLLLALASR